MWYSFWSLVIHFCNTRYFLFIFFPSLNNHPLLILAFSRIISLLTPWLMWREMTFAYNRCPIGSGELTVLCNYGKIINKIILCQCYILICLSRHCQKIFFTFLLVFSHFLFTPLCSCFICYLICLYLLMAIFCTFAHSEYLYWIKCYFSILLIYLIGAHISIQIMIWFCPYIVSSRTQRKYLTLFLLSIISVFRTVRNNKQYIF